MFSDALLGSRLDTEGYASAMAQPALLPFALFTMTPPTLSDRPLRHFLQLIDLTSHELRYVLERARVIKDKFKRYQPHHTLHDRTLAMVFEKASTRTRVSFEAGMYQLGGSVIHLTTTIRNWAAPSPSKTPRGLSRAW